MAEYTTNYQLHQWAADDDFLREDFNEDFAKIDAALGNCGNCSIVTGTYTGAGGYNTTRNTLTFSKPPVAIFISGNSYTAVLLRGASGFSVGSNANVGMIYPTWGSDGSVSWRSGGNEYYQMNVSGATYTYFALLA